MRDRPGRKRTATPDGRQKPSANRGLLRVPDPLAAPEFLGLLVTGRASDRSWYGAVRLPDAEIERLVTGGVAVFLRACGRRPPPSR